MDHRILIAGFGGQGVMLMGQLLSYGAFLEKREVVFLPTYGGEQRGGTANCSVIVSDEPIGSPNVRSYDTVVVMNQPSFVKYGGSVKPSGTLLCNSSLVSITQEETKASLLEIPAVSVAEELGSPKAANMILLGALTGICGMVALESVAQAVEEKLGKRPELLEINKRGLHYGYEMARNK